MLFCILDGPPRQSILYNVQIQSIRLFHYENMPMQYIEIVLSVKIEKFIGNFFIFFLFFAQNIDCRCRLEPTIYVLEQK